MRVFVTGSIAYDYIMVFPAGFKTTSCRTRCTSCGSRSWSIRLTRRRGGTGANIAYNLGLLGERPVLVGTVGEDFAEYRSWLESIGVDCRAVKVIAGEHTASCFINTDLQDNQITAFYPGAMAHARTISLNEAECRPGRPGLDRAQRSRRDEPRRHRMHRAGHSLSLRSGDAVAQARAGRPREGMPRRPDPGGQRLRVRNDGRKAGDQRGRAAADGADHGHDARRGRLADHRR